MRKYLAQASSMFEFYSALDPDSDELWDQIWSAARLEFTLGNYDIDIITEVEDESA